MPAAVTSAPIAMNSKCTGYWMENGHFRQRIGHDQGNPGSQKIRNNDRRPCQTNGDAASQKQTHTDSATNSHHGELALAQPALEPLCVCQQRLFVSRSGSSDAFFMELTFACDSFFSVYLRASVSPW